MVGGGVQVFEMYFWLLTTKNMLKIEPKEVEDEGEDEYSLY